MYINRIEPVSAYGRGSIGELVEFILVGGGWSNITMRKRTSVEPSTWYPALLIIESPLGLMNSEMEVDLIEGVVLVTVHAPDHVHGDKVAGVL